jgi:hypothetical protein
MPANAKYDVALSFAGEDREYVERVATLLSAEGVSVFYDKFEEADLWGKNLYTYFREVYRDHARYTIVFCSKHYAKKVWTNYERESAQERAVRESSEYILPARFDDTEVPGLPSTVSYLDLKQIKPEGLVRSVLIKLGRAETLPAAQHGVDMSVLVKGVRKGLGAVRT